MEVVLLIVGIVVGFWRKRKKELLPNYRMYHTNVVQIIGRSHPFIPP